MSLSTGQSYLGLQSKTTAYGISVSKTTNNKKKRKLSYDYQGLSNQILRAKTSIGAGQAVITAKQKVFDLYRKLRSGEYDDKAIELAIAHAKQLERAAKKKEQHLLEEEDARRYMGSDVETELEEAQEENENTFSEEELQEKMQELMKEMERLEKEMQEMELPETELLNADGTMSEENFERVKQKHRSEEWKDIVIANMRYLRSVFGNLQEQKNNAASGVALELGGVEQPVSVSAAVSAPPAGNVDVRV